MNELLLYMLLAVMNVYELLLYVHLAVMNVYELLLYVHVAAFVHVYDLLLHKWYELLLYMCMICFGTYV